VDLIFCILDVGSDVVVGRICFYCCCWRLSLSRATKRTDKILGINRIRTFYGSSSRDHQALDNSLHGCGGCFRVLVFSTRNSPMLLDGRGWSQCRES
jgi:hypothetical protein